MTFLRNLVLKKIQELGVGEASLFFGVGKQLVRQWLAGSKPISLSAVEKVFEEPAVFPAGETIQASWEGKKVAILLPWYKHTNPLTAFSVMGLIDRAKMSILMRYSDAFIVHTRNNLAEMFLSTGIEWSIWFDDDMVVPWGNAQWFNHHTGLNLPEQFAGAHTINRLMSHGKTLIGGLYFGRSTKGKPMYAEATASTEEAQFAHEAPRNLIKPTRWVATGCMLVHKSVYTDIQKTFPHLAPTKGEAWNFFSNTQDDLSKNVRECFEILNDSGVTENARIEKAKEALEKGRRLSEINSRLVQGEDVTFCVRAGRSGHVPYVDLGLVCAHVGSLCYGPKNTAG